MINTLAIALSSLLALPASLACPAKSHTNTPCRPVSGDKMISSFQLVLYNSTVAVWDPYMNSVVDTIAVPGLSFNPALHSSGGISGDNFLIKYDVASRRVLRQRNLTAVTGGVYGGFQDTAYSTTFVLGTFLSSVIRVSADSETAATWYLQTPPDHTVHGLSGLVSLPDDKSLLVVDNADGQLYRFDISAAERTPVGGSVYAVSEWFVDDKVAGTLAGNRTKRPLVNIPAQINALLI
ncbi:hypothetical protein CTA1_12035 [Colletotrichum tanaceti]|uniref:Uncharacterized protein n=1 Tax=Colletotrichum tanaceti TaxID=1306861 RepID=A0A4U6X8K5_9PEZI|nr:hypothetical protein CTA1_12035 [Colletotrichum tanaceti]